VVGIGGVAGVRCCGWCAPKCVAACAGSSTVLWQAEAVGAAWGNALLPARQKGHVPVGSGGAMVVVWWGSCSNATANGGCGRQRAGVMRALQERGVVKGSVLEALHAMQGRRC